MQEQEKFATSLANLVGEYTKNLNSKKQNLQSQILKFVELNKLLINKLAEEKSRNNELLSKYTKLVEISRKVEQERKKLKAMNIDLLQQNSKLKENSAIGFKKGKSRELKIVLDKLKDKHSLSKRAHKSLLREHEEIKIELNKRVQVEKARSGFYKKKYSNLYKNFKKIVKNSNSQQDLNSELVEKISILEKKSNANDIILNKKSNHLKELYEEKVKFMAKQYLEKEIEYRARIESLNKDLRRYYDELRDSKKEHFAKEEILKEKVNQITKIFN